MVFGNGRAQQSMIYGSHVRWGTLLTIDGPREGERCELFRTVLDEEYESGCISYRILSIMLAWLRRARGRPRACLTPGDYGTRSFPMGLIRRTSTSRTSPS